LIAQLVRLGAHVVALDLGKTAKRLTSFSNRQDDMDVIMGDMLDQSVIAHGMKSLLDGDDKKHAVFHLAGMSDASQCDKEPKNAVQQNVGIITNLLEACCEHGVKRVIYPSTAYVYGAQYDRPIDENDDLNPVGIYSLTKLLAEEVIQGYSRLHDLSCDNVRISNIYGPASKPTTIFGTMLFQARTKKEIILHNLEPIRDFIFIDDVVVGLIKVLLAGDEPGCRTFNLSTGIGTSIGQMAKIFCQSIGLESDAIKCDNQPGVTSVLVLLNEKMKQRTDWKPGIDLVDGINMTLAELEDKKYAEA
jgi:UDP-glucose 4-epimerase